MKAGIGAAAGTALAPRTPGDEPPLVLSVDGAIVSTADLKRQRDFFEGVFGLRPVAVEKFGEAQVQALWGVKGRSAQSVLLETPATGVGVRLLQFEPASDVVIREGALGVDCDALKVFDFTLGDWERGVQALRARGYELAGAPAEYALPEMGRFTEGHVQGPEGVIAALIKFHDSPRTRFVRAVEPTFSEMLGVSGPVSEIEPVRAFYATLGLEVVLQYSVETESFAKLIGQSRTTRLTGTNFGRSERAPMIGIIHYGLPKGAYKSLRERATLPNRGAAALRLRVRSAALAEAACRRAGYEVLAPEARVSVKPHGEVRSLTLRAPHGVVHHLLEHA